MVISERAKEEMREVGEAIGQEIKEEIDPTATVKYKDVEHKEHNRPNASVQQVREDALQRMSGWKQCLL